VTPQQLKDTLLAGFPLTDPKGRPFPDAALQASITEAEAHFKKRHGVLLTRHLVRMGETTTPNDDGLPEVMAPSPDAFQNDFVDSRYALKHLPYGPVKSRDDILSVKIMYGPANFEVLDFRPNWYALDTNRYTLRLFPSGYSDVSISILAYKVFSSLNRTIPNAYRITYKAGYEDVEAEDPELAGMILRRAAINVLPQLALFSEGGSQYSSVSVSVDGLSQSRSQPVSAQAHKFGPQQKAMQDILDEYIKLNFNFNSRSFVFV
jgi:hypothetical protein